jgi:hypothetical protein
MLVFNITYTSRPVHTTYNTLALISCMISTVGRWEEGEWHCNINNKEIMKMNPHHSHRRWHAKRMDG